MPPRLRPVGRANGPVVPVLGHPLLLPQNLPLPLRLRRGGQAGGPLGSWRGSLPPPLRLLVELPKGMAPVAVAAVVALPPKMLGKVAVVLFVVVQQRLLILQPSTLLRRSLLSVGLASSLSVVDLLLVSPAPR